MLYALPVRMAGGNFFLGFRDKQIGNDDYDGYFAVMGLVRPLFDRADFRASTVGFYINRIGVSENNITLRLNYFSTNVPETVRVIEQFVSGSNKLAIIKCEHPNLNKSNEEYSDGSPASELDFKNFLDANTRICVEVLNGFGRDNTRDVVGHYILGDMLQENRPETVIEEQFGQYSNSYRELKARSLARRYWDDMFRWHRPDSVGLHFMANLLVVREVPYDHPAIRALFERLLHRP